MKKICIVGVGKVGSSIAFALLFRVASCSICLIDRNPAKLEGEYRDLSHASYLLHERNIFFKGNWKNMNDSDVVIISAGHARKNVKETDFTLFRKNHPLIKEIFSHFNRNISRNVKIIMVTNPAGELAESFHCEPAGKVLDYIRNRTDRKSGRYILEKKGYTNWGITAEVWRDV